MNKSATDIPSKVKYAIKGSGMSHITPTLLNLYNIGTIIIPNATKRLK